MPTQTLLQACNETLLNIGELEQSDLSTPVGKKVRLSTISAIRAVSSLHAWQHLQATITATSWSGATATLAPIQELYSVALGTEVLHSVGFDELWERSQRIPATATPLYFARAEQNTVLVYPNPTTAEQAAMRFRVLLQPATPNVASDSFTLPDDFYDLVQTYSQMLMHRNHTADAAAMEACSREFELRTHMVRTRQTSQVVGNMGGHPV